MRGGKGQAVKKTDPPASLAKTRQDLNDTPTTATTRSGGLRCLSAQKRSLAVKKTDPPASLAKTRPDTPTTGTTATTRTTTGTTATTRSKKAFHTIYLSSTRWTQMPIGTEAISGRKKRRSRRLVSPREDLIPQLQELQRWTVSTYRHESEVRPSKKTVPPASFAKSRRIMPTTHLHQLHAVRRPLRVDSTCVNQHSATHGEYVRIVSANNPARLDARRAIFVMSYMEHVPYACAASLGKQAVRVPEIRDAQPVAEKYTARSAALLSGCVHAGAAHPGHIRRGFRDGLHERSASPCHTFRTFPRTPADQSWLKPLSHIQNLPPNTSRPRLAEAPVTLSEPSPEHQPTKVGLSSGAV
ncbi:hypothetical protein Bbelb_329790 [Branchiostoma belcheri]|nr:hypothetical protein Bbelb_329790 [Branchiostoma belcheri]